MPKKRTKKSLPDFSYTLDDQGFRIYSDPVVAKVYGNLRNLSDLVERSQDKADNEFQDVARMIMVDGKQDKATDFLINIICSSFEFIGEAEFAGAKIAAWLITGLIDTYRESTPTDLQGEIDDAWQGLSKAFQSVSDDVSDWMDKPEKYWGVKYTSPYSTDTASIDDLNVIDMIPNNSQKEFKEAAILIGNKAKYLVTKSLFHRKWRFENTNTGVWWDAYYTRWNSNYDWDGPKYDGLNIQCMFGECTSFVDQIVDNVLNSNHAIYISTEHHEEFTHNWFSNDTNYVGNYYRQWLLQDDNGTAPEELLHWLYTDGPTANPDGIASMSDVFTNWELAGKPLPHIIIKECCFKFFCRKK